VAPRPFYDRAGAWILREIAKLISGVANGGLGSAVGIAILVLATISLIVVLARYSRSLRPDPSLRPAVDVDTGRPARDWLREAVEHERAGEWRDALRCRYRALVAELAEEGLIDEIPGRTTGEYRVFVAGRVPLAAPPFAGASELFERAWYGHRLGEAEDAARFRDLANEVLTAAAQR
jgi:hypothetical protein